MRTEVRGRPVNLGVYVNADEIAVALWKQRSIELAEYRVRVDERSLRDFASRSGLLNRRFTRRRMLLDHRFVGTEFHLLRTGHLDHFAQLLAAYLCDQLLVQRVQFSFETVFSHPSKLALMRRAMEAGYKVYLYFIATNSAEINVDRVRIRVANGGHDVPREKVVERYGRSLKQLLPAIDLCYHAFVFDNSTAFDGGPSEPLLFAEMKQAEIGRVWSWDTRRVPDWFVRDYLIASGEPIYLDVARKVLEQRGAA